MLTFTRSIVTMRSNVSPLPFLPFLPLHRVRLTWPLARAPLSSARPDEDRGRGYGGPSLPSWPIYNKKNNLTQKLVYPPNSTADLLSSSISVNKTAKRAKVPRQKLTTNIFKNQGKNSILIIIIQSQCCSLRSQCCKMRLFGIISKLSDDAKWCAKACNFGR